MIAAVYASEPTAPVTVEVLARAIKAAQAAPPWYESEPFKTLVAVMIGGLLALAANWWLKRLEIRARANALKVAFRGEIGALRAALRADAKELSSGLVVTPSAIVGPFGEIAYPSTVFDGSAGHIGDVGDPVLVRQLTGLYTMLRRLEALGRVPQARRDHLERMAAGLGSALYMATLVDMRLGAQTSGLEVGNFKIVVSDTDAADQLLARTLIERHGTKADQRVVEENPPPRKATP